MGQGDTQIPYGTPPIVGRPDEGSSNLQSILDMMRGQQQGGGLAVNENWQSGEPTFVPGRPGIPAPPASPLPTMASTPQLPPGSSPLPGMGGGGMRPGGIAPTGEPQGPQGPAKYPIQHPNIQQTEFRSKSGRNAAVMNNALQGLMNFGQRLAQQKYDKGAEAAKQATVQLTLAMQKSAELRAKAQQTQKTDPETAKLLLAQADENDKKVASMQQDKNFIKTMKDATKPGSAAYVGVQQAYAYLKKQNEDDKIMEAFLAAKQAEAQEKMADALKKRAEAARTGFDPETGKIDPSKMYGSPDTESRIRSAEKIARERNATEIQKAILYSGGKLASLKQEFVYDKAHDQYYQRFSYMDRHGKPQTEMKPLPKGFVPEKDLPVIEEKVKTDEFGGIEQQTTVKEKGKTTIVKPPNVPGPGLSIDRNSSLNPYRAYGMSPTEARRAGAYDVVDYWSYYLGTHGKLPPGTPPSLRKAVMKKLPELGIEVGEPPSAMAKSRSAAAAPLIGWSGDKMVPEGGLIDKTERDIELAAGAGKDDPLVKQQAAKLAAISRSVGMEVGTIDSEQKYKTFIERWTARARQELGTLAPAIATVQGDLTSVYSYAGSMHGWRALQVAEEFERKFGGLTTRPDSVIAGMEALKEAANLTLQYGDLSYRGFKDKEQPLGQPSKSKDDSGYKVMTPKEFMNKK